VNEFLYYNLTTTAGTDWPQLKEQKIDAIQGTNLTQLQARIAKCSG
jgi:hypothetical protein